MLFNHNQIKKVNEKKVLRKHKKQWIIVSVAAFSLFTGTQLATAHADTTANVSSNQSTQTQTTSSGNTQTSSSADTTTNISSSATSSTTSSVTSTNPTSSQATTSTTSSQTTSSSSNQSSTSSNTTSQTSTSSATTTNADDDISLRDATPASANSLVESGAYASTYTQYANAYERYYRDYIDSDESNDSGMLNAYYNGLTYESFYEQSLYSLTNGYSSLAAVDSNTNSVVTSIMAMSNYPNSINTILYHNNGTYRDNLSAESKALSNYQTLLSSANIDNSGYATYASQYTSAVNNNDINTANSIANTVSNNYNALNNSLVQMNSQLSSHPYSASIASAKSVTLSAFNTLIAINTSIASNGYWNPQSEALSSARASFVASAEKTIHQLPEESGYESARNKIQNDAYNLSTYFGTGQDSSQASASNSSAQSLATGYLSQTASIIGSYASLSSQYTRTHSVMTNINQMASSATSLGSAAASNYNASSFNVSALNYYLNEMSKDMNVTIFLSYDTTSSNYINNLKNGNVSSADSIAVQASSNSSVFQTMLASSYASLTMSAVSAIPATSEAIDSDVTALQNLSAATNWAELSTQLSSAEYQDTLDSVAHSQYLVDSASAEAMLSSALASAAKSAASDSALASDNASNALSEANSLASSALSSALTSANQRNTSYTQDQLSFANSLALSTYNSGLSSARNSYLAQTASNNSNNNSVVSAVASSAASSAQSSASANLASVLSSVHASASAALSNADNKNTTTTATTTTTTTSPTVVTTTTTVDNPSLTSANTSLSSANQSLTAEIKSLNASFTSVVNAPSSNEKSLTDSLTAINQSLTAQNQSLQTQLTQLKNENNQTDTKDTVHDLSNNDYIKINRNVSATYKNGKKTTLKLSHRPRLQFKSVKFNGDQVQVVAKYNRKLVTLTMKTSDYQRAYVGKDESVKKVFIASTVKEYTKPQFGKGKAVRTLHKNSLVHVKKIVDNGLTTRYELANGHFITTNKYFVKPL